MTSGMVEAILEIVRFDPTLPNNSSAVNPVIPDILNVPAEFVLKPSVVNPVTVPLEVTLVKPVPL